MLTNASHGVSQQGNNQADPIPSTGSIIISTSTTHNGPSSTSISVKPTSKPSKTTTTTKTQTLSSIGGPTRTLSFPLELPTTIKFNASEVHINGNEPGANCRISAADPPQANAIWFCGGKEQISTIKFNDIGGQYYIDDGQVPAKFQAVLGVSPILEGGPWTFDANYFQAPFAGCNVSVTLQVWLYNQTYYGFAQ